MVPEDVTGTLNVTVTADDKTTSVLTGICVLILILLISIMFTIAPMIAGTGQNPGIQKPTSSDLSGSEDTRSIATVQITPSPVITPVIISSTPVSTPVTDSSSSAVIPAAPRSYVTIEAVPVTSAPKLQDITQHMPIPSTDDYFTIYAINDQDAVTTLPYVSFNLVNPPLVIDYDITPLNISEEKDLDYKIISTVFHEKLTINRPYEQDWFRVIVRDRNTGKVVAEDGYGRTYSLDSPKKLVVYNGGNFRFEFSGEYVNVSLTMKVKKEGNIP